MSESPQIFFDANMNLEAYLMSQLFVLLNNYYSLWDLGLN